MLARLLFVVGGFFAGVLLSFVGAGLLVRLTYACVPADAPCDGGAYAGIGLFILLAPILGPLFSWLGYRVYIRHIASQE
jgi:hypothetical protein